MRTRIATLEPSAASGAPDGGARERERLAYAIHDGLTQVVTASVLELEWLARRAGVSPEEAAEALRQAASELRRALEEIRGVLARLSPGSPGGHEGLEELMRSLRERWQLPADWTIDGDLRRVAPDVLEVASAVIREGVTNAAKHAGTARVRARVVVGDDLEVRVEDDGRGFEPDAAEPGDGHLGLALLRRRVEETGGVLRVESSPAGGTRVIARLPLTSQGAEP